KTFTYTVSADDPNPLINEATITCGVVGFDNTVSDTDSHSLDWVAPAIEVTKSGPLSAKVGDEITYTIGVANIGIGAVENCTGTDTVLGALGAFEPGAPRTFTRVLLPDDPNPLINEATITCGVVGFDNTVSDTDSHSLDWVAPAIEVTKSGPLSAKVGDEITYTIGVAN
ncbi:MAG: hypothetical protein RQ729_13540, partial [Wenzhouxiangellaceae bacterium]|nr:hypothetical protein [Wenzhouxiangellaceae bacterium]